MSHDDFAVEHMRGIPAALPDGERLLWQGAPEWRALALHAFHVRKVVLYFGVLILARVAFGAQEGQSAAVMATSCLWLATLGATATGLLALLAWLTARATVYSITSGRLILRFGVAVPITINIPYALVQSADLKRFGDDSAELSVGLIPQQRIGWLVTWPHVRPGHFSHPQPCLRGLRGADEPAALLAKALEAEAGGRAAATSKPDSKAATDAGRHQRPWHAEAV